MHCDDLSIFCSDGQFFPAKESRLYAVMTVWNEEDIIESTVRNLFAEGCDEVFFLDNGSEDATISRAVEAGATCMGQFLTEIFHDNVRTDKINELIQTVNDERRHDRTWWLNLDADEFPTGPNHTTVREYLEGLDDRIRCVGSWWINHYPGSRPYFIPGFHPADFQLLAGTMRPKVGYTIWGDYCPQKHVKHHLLRFDKGAGELRFGLGAHVFFSDEKLCEPIGGIVTHHFQFRDPVVTHNKLSKLTEKNEDGYSRHASKNMWDGWENGTPVGSSRHQYNSRATIALQMYDPKSQREILGFAPRRWMEEAAELFGGEEGQTVSRWYDDASLFAAVEKKLSAENFILWKIDYLFGNKRFQDVADIYDECRDVALLSSERCMYIEAVSNILSENKAGALMNFKKFRMQHPKSRYVGSLAAMLSKA